MLSIHDIIRDADNEDIIEDESHGLVPSLEDLEKTASYLKMIATPDREVDLIAKGAIIKEATKNNKPNKIEKENTETTKYAALHSTYLNVDKLSAAAKNRFSV